MSDYRNSDEASDHMSLRAGKIIELITNNYDSFTKEETEALNICNKSMDFCVQHNLIEKAYWESINTLELIENILKSKEF